MCDSMHYFHRKMKLRGSLLQVTISVVYMTQYISLSKSFIHCTVEKFDNIGQQLTGLHKEIIVLFEQLHTL